MTTSGTAAACRAAARPRTICSHAHSAPSASPPCFCPSLSFYVSWCRRTKSSQFSERQRARPMAPRGDDGSATAAAALPCHACACAPPPQLPPSRRAPPTNHQTPTLPPVKKWFAASGACVGRWGSELSAPVHMRGEYGCVNDVYTFLALYRDYRARGENTSKKAVCLLTLERLVWDGDEKSACFFATGDRPPPVVPGVPGYVRSRVIVACSNGAN